jgi:hypothetical protein
MKQTSEWSYEKRNTRETNQLHVSHSNEAEQKREFLILEVSI